MSTRRRSKRSGRSGAAIVAVASMLLAAVGSAAGDELLYYVEDGAVVITNDAGRPDARPVPLRRAPQVASITPERSASTTPATPWDTFIGRVADEQGISPTLIKAVAWAESAFDPQAVSSKGAIGLMQLMPATADLYGVRNPRDPYENLQAGARHLRHLLEEFEGNVTLALAAYNAGSQAVRKYGGVPPYPETRTYLERVKRRLSYPRRAPAPPPDPVRLQHTADGRIVLSN